MSSSERLKTVVRRLPPNLPESIFWQSVSPWVTEDNTTWKSYHQGKLKKKADKETISSRAYIAFKTPVAVATFSREYDGHLFRDKQGNESFAVVEYAPFQKVPPEKKKVDGRMGTILQDVDYLSFVESLENSTSAIHNADAPELAAPPSSVKTTPLLEALKAQKAAAKDAAQILSYHGHYSATDRRHATGGSKAAKDDDPNVFSRKAALDPPSASIPANSSTAKSESKGRQNPNNSKPPVSGQATGKKRRNRSNSVSSVIVSQQTPPTPKSRVQQGKQVSTHPPPLQSAPAATTDATVAPSQQSSQPPKERERKRPLLNPRMFEAAIAGVGGPKATTGQRDIARKERREAKKAEGLDETQPSVGGAADSADKGEKDAPKEKREKGHPKAKNSNKTPRPARTGDSPAVPLVILARNPAKTLDAGDANGSASAPKLDTETPASIEPSSSHSPPTKRGRGRGRGGRGGG